jgi:hypothetical protein
MLEELAAILQFCSSPKLTLGPILSGIHIGGAAFICVCGTISHLFLVAHFMTAMTGLDEYLTDVSRAN